FERRQRRARSQYQFSDAGQGGRDARRASLPAARTAVDAALWLRASTWTSSAPPGDGRLVEAPRLAGRSRAHRADGGCAAWTDLRPGLGPRSGRHAPHGGGHLLWRANDRAADAIEDARRGDGYRRDSPRCARDRMPFDSCARALLHAADAEPDIGGDVGTSPTADRRHCREVPP